LRNRLHDNSHTPDEQANDDAAYEDTSQLIGNASEPFTPQACELRQRDDREEPCDNRCASAQEDDLHT
jgi:hypothetical protein